MVTFAPQSPEAPYSMNDSMGWLVVCEEWECHSPGFKGEDGMQILTGKNQNQRPDISLRGVRQGRPTWRV